MNDRHAGDSPQRRTTRLDDLWPRRRPVVMAILNCTPDSFSDGGRFLARDAAIDHAEDLIRDGADIVDIGGESTRPGADPVPTDEEMRRVLPVIEELRGRHPSLPLSVDTSKVEVAAAGLEAGADLINDVTAASDTRLLDLVAAHGAAIVLMHRRGEPRTMQRDTAYDDVVTEVKEYLRQRAVSATDAGIPAHRVWIDPGVGFGKNVDGNLRLLAALPEFADLGYPVMVGASRKSFIGEISGADVAARLPGSLAALIPAIRLPRVVVRVHDPRPSVQFLEVASRLAEAGA